MKLKEIFERAENCSNYNEFKRNLLKEFWGKELTPSYSKAMEKIRVSFGLPIEQKTLFDENKLEKIVQRIRKKIKNQKTKSNEKN
jgi:isochorismate hydrolase